MNRIFITLIAFQFSTVYAAQETCEVGRGVKTPYGKLITTECSDAKGYTTRQFISLNEMWS